MMVGDNKKRSSTLLKHMAAAGIVSGLLLGATGAQALGFGLPLNGVLGATPTFPALSLPGLPLNGVLGATPTFPALSLPGLPLNGVLGATPTFPALSLPGLPLSGVLGSTPTLPALPGF